MAIKGYWKFNGNSNDYSGLGFNGTDTNIIYSQANGVINGGAKLNGSSSKIVIAANSGHSISGNITISALFKFNTIPSANSTQMIISKEGINNNVGFNMQLDTDGAVGTVGILIGSYQYSGNLVYYTRTYTPLLYDTKWHLICGTFEDNLWKLYVDSILLIETAGNNIIGALVDNDKITIGCYLVSGVYSRFLNGCIDELKIDSSPHTSAKIKNEYARIKGFF